jgi:hypothetical protein
MFISAALGEVGVDILQEHPGSWWLRELNHNITWVEVGVDKVVH